MEPIQREENPSGYVYQASQISSPDLQICQNKTNHEVMVPAYLVNGCRQTAHYFAINPIQ
jgi:hypothetical protein